MGSQLKIHLFAPKDKTKWNSIWKKCFNIWKQTQYEIKIWSDEELNSELEQDDKVFYNTYLAKLDPIYKWDLARYIILGKYGGAYFDMDVELKMDFLSLLNPNKIYIAEGEDNCLVSNHIIISPLDYLYWYNIRQQLKYKVIQNFEKCKQYPFWTIETVGPIGLSYVLSKEKYQYTPLSRYHFGSQDTNLQLCIHHATHTWTQNKKAPFKPSTNVAFKN